jgi:hypothetical protein
MTHHDLDPRDELASAHLDGRTTPDQAAEIEADPELRARVAAMAAVRDALRAPVVVDPAARERAIEAALAAAAPRSQGEATVADLSAVAARRRVPSRRLRILGIAAVLALLALALPLLAQLGDDSSDQDMAATAPDAPERSSDDAAGAGGDAAEEAGEDGEAEAGAPSAEAYDATAGAADLPDAGDLGTFDDPAALTERVESLLVDRDESGPAPATSSSRQLGGSGSSCRDQAEGAGEAGSAIVLVATAVLDDLDVELTVVARPDDRRTMTVAAAETCEPVLTTDVTP